MANANDSGPGSFRAAIDRANANSAVTTIQFIGRVSTIALQQTVWFNGPQNLTINGTGAILDGTNADGPAFRTTGGGDLTVVNLTVRNAPAEGIAIEVPSSATGTVRVKLRDVEIIDNAGHGVLVNDQDDPATPVDRRRICGVASTSLSSARVSSATATACPIAMVFASTRAVKVISRSPCCSRSPRTMRQTASRSTSVANGDVRLEMFGTRIRRNGKFDPADLDDGFDIDEAGDGSVLGSVMLSEANDNYEEGFDFNENDAGDLRVDMLLVEASRNGEEGIDYEEDDDFAGGGDLVTTMDLVKTNGNRGGDAGLKIREKGEGSLDVTLKGVEASNNLAGGISVREDAVGTLTAAISRAKALANTGHGIDFDENRGSAADVMGILTATVSQSTSSGNGGAGVRADSQTPGVGTLLLTKVTLEGNTGGATTGGNVIVTIVP